jgi:hypothetical protein
MHRYPDHSVSVPIGFRLAQIPALAERFRQRRPGATTTKFAP